jgi:type I restriction enzyme M protein
MSQNNKLIDIMELLRKDTGINNAIDSMEQLSLLLIVKYFFEGAPSFYLNIESSFNHLFLERGEFNQNGIASNFNYLKLKLNGIVNDIDSNEKKLKNEILAFNFLSKFESILDITPFKIRSERIFKSILYRLDRLDYYGNGLENDFDELLQDMVKDSSSSGAFHSPKSLIKAMIKVTRPLPGESVYDPAMGTGRTFVETQKYLATINQDSEFRAIGNDISPFAYLIGTLNLLLNGIDISDISISDSLLCSEDFKYDIIISGIPFGKTSQISKYEYDYHGYSGSLEAMFLKHTMDKLAIGGRAAIIVPDGVLFNTSNQLDMLRKQLLTKFNLHSILSLPNGALAPYSGVKVSVLFFENTVPEKDIWFYELSTVKPLNKLNSISDSDFEEFISQFESRETGRNSCLIDKQSLIKNKAYNLGFSLPKKEDKLKFKKKEMIDSLKKEQSTLIKLIASHFENMSRNIGVEYSEKVTIKSICKLKTGGNLNKSEVSDSGEYPVYGGNGIIGYYGERNRLGDSIIIGKVGMYCGNIHYSSKPYWLTSNAISLELTDSRTVFAPYLAHVLKSLDLNKMSTGAVQQFISITQLYSLEISIPSYEKQVELSNWFNSLEENKEEIQQQLSNFSDQLNSITTSSIIEKALKNGGTL